MQDMSTTGICACLHLNNATLYHTVLKLSVAVSGTVARAEIPLLDKKHILSISVQYVLTFGRLPTTAF